MSLIIITIHAHRQSETTQTLLTERLTLSQKRIPLLIENAWVYIKHTRKK